MWEQLWYVACGMWWGRVGRKGILKKKIFFFFKWKEGVVKKKKYIFFYSFSWLKSKGESLIAPDPISKINPIVNTIKNIRAIENPKVLT